MSVKNIGTKLIVALLIAVVTFVGLNAFTDGNVVLAAGPTCTAPDYAAPLKGGKGQVHIEWAAPEATGDLFIVLVDYATGMTEQEILDVAYRQEWYVPRTGGNVYGHPSIDTGRYAIVTHHSDRWGVGGLIEVHPNQQNRPLCWGNPTIAVEEVVEKLVVEPAVAVTSTVTTTTTVTADAAVVATPPPVGVTGVATGTVMTGDPASLKVYTKPENLVAGESADVYVEVRDDLDFLVTGTINITWITSVGVITPQTSSTINGVARTKYSSTAAGTATINAATDTISKDYEIDVLPGGPVTTTVLLGKLQAGVGTEVLVTATDQYGNAVEDYTLINLKADNGVLGATQGVLVGGSFRTDLFDLQPGPVSVTAVVTDSPVKPNVAVGETLTAVEIEIAGETDTLGEAWYAAYGSWPTTDQWVAYAAANGIEITGGIPIVYFGNVLTFYVPLAP